MDELRMTIDGVPHRVPHGITVAAALMNTETPRLRTSVTGAPRAALCGMGICYECRVTIDGVPKRRSCNVLVREGMEVARS